MLGWVNSGSAQKWGTKIQPPPPPPRIIPKYSTSNYSKIDSMDKFLKNIDMYNKLSKMSEDGTGSGFLPPEFDDYVRGLPKKIIFYRANIYESGWEDFKDIVLSHAYPDPYAESQSDPGYISEGGRRMRPKTRRIRRKQNKRRLTKKYI
jgi:hypothetical protein